MQQWEKGLSSMRLAAAFSMVYKGSYIDTNLLQVIGRPSTYCMSVRKCVATRLKQIQPSLKISLL